MAEKALGRRFQSETVGFGSVPGIVFASSGSGVDGRKSVREEVPFRDCRGKEGVEQDMVSGLFLVKSLCSSGLRVNGRNSIREEVPFRYSIRGRKE